MRVVYLETIIRPTSKLHITILVIEWEPGDINGTGGHEDPWREDLDLVGVVEECYCVTWWNVSAEPLVGHHHVGRVGRVKSFTGTRIIDYCSRERDRVSCQVSSM